MATMQTIQVSGLGRSELAALRKQAKTLGLSAEGYATQLIKDGMSLEHLARTKSFDELFAPVQARFREIAMTEDDLDKLVDAARTRHHKATSKKR